MHVYNGVLTILGYKFESQYTQELLSCCNYWL